MKNKTEKIKWYKLTINQCLHHWANGHIPKDKKVNKSSYSWTHDKMYCNNKLVAINYNNIFWIKSFDNISSYENGLASYNVSRAIPENKVKFTLSDFPKIFADFEMTDEEKIKFIHEEFLRQNKHNLDSISYFKEVIENNRILNLHRVPILNIDHVNELQILFGKKVYNKALKQKIAFNTEYKYYKGWSSHNYDVLQTLKHNCSIQELSDKGLDLFFNKEEIEILNMKHWIDKYGKVYKSKQYRSWKNEVHLSNKFAGYAKSLKEYKQIWFSDKREEYCKAIELAKEEETKRKELERLKEKEKVVKLALLKIENFREDENSFLKLHSLGYTVLKLKSIDNPTGNQIMSDKPLPKEIISSLGMRIKIEEAKKALKLFRAKETKHDLVQGFKYNGIVKRQIPYLDEQQEVQYREEDCISIGCHLCPESEIKAFLEYYKLDW